MPRARKLLHPIAARPYPISFKTSPAGVTTLYRTQPTARGRVTTSLPLAAFRQSILAVRFSPPYAARMNINSKDGSRSPRTGTGPSSEVTPLYGDRSQFEAMAAQQRRRGLRAVPFRVFVPNLVTLLALSIGLTAI